MRRDRLAVALAGALVLLAGLGARDFWEPDEPRHGAIAEELRALRAGPSELVLPRLNGEPYTQKPPLYYWLAALAGTPGGRVSEGAARLPSALAALGTLWIVYRLGRATFGAPSALLAAAMLTTLPAFVELARSARPDSLLVFFVTSALLLAWRIDRGAAAARDRRLLHAAVGLGILAKGPVAALLPLLGLLAYLVWERRPADLRRFVSLDAAALSLGPALAWLALATALAPAGFFDEAVRENLLGRYFSGTEHARSATFYLWQLPVSFLPWTLAWLLVAVPRVRRGLAGDATSASALRFLVAFVCVGLVFFSLSAGKRSAYLAPLFPALALLTAQVMRSAAAGTDLGARAGRWLALAPAAAACGLALAAASVPGLPALVAPCLMLSAIALVLPWERAYGWRPLAARGFVLLVAVETILHAVYLPTLDPDRSIRAAAAAAGALAPEGTSIGLLRNGSLVGGVAYYGERPVEQLGSRKGVRRFLEKGGRVVIAEEQHLRELEALPTRVAFRQDLDGDGIVVVVADAAAETPP